jgi:hypothetical protein
METMLRAAATGAFMMLASSVAGVAPAVAQEELPRLRTTADLRALCHDGAPSMRIGQCNGFIAGTGLLYRKLRHAGLISDWACAPEGTDVDVARAAFVAWADANPTEADSHPIDGFWAAMAARWPCR